MSRRRFLEVMTQAGLADRDIEFARLKGARDAANAQALSQGIDKVWVNGRLVFQERRSTGARAGHVVRATRVSP